MSSQAFLGPTPIRQKSSSPFLQLATALLDTAAGIDGSLGSFAPSTTAAQSNSIKKPKNFFIGEILRVRGSEGKDQSAGSVTQNHVFKTKSCDGTPGRNLRKASSSTRASLRPPMVWIATTAARPTHRTSFSSTRIKPRMIVEPKT